MADTDNNDVIIFSFFKWEKTHTSLSRFQMREDSHTLTPLCVVEIRIAMTRRLTPGDVLLHRTTSDFQQVHRTNFQCPNKLVTADFIVFGSSYSFQIHCCFFFLCSFRIHSSFSSIRFGFRIHSSFFFYLIRISVRLCLVSFLTLFFDWTGMFPNNLFFYQTDDESILMSFDSPDLGLFKNTKNTKNP